MSMVPPSFASLVCLYSFLPPNGSPKVGLFAFMFTSYWTFYLTGPWNSDSLEKDCKVYQETKSQQTIHLNSQASVLVIAAVS